MIFSGSFSCTLEGVKCLFTNVLAMKEWISNTDEYSTREDLWKLKNSVTEGTNIDLPKHLQYLKEKIDEDYNGNKIELEDLGINDSDIVSILNYLSHKSDWLKKLTTVKISLRMKNCNIIIPFLKEMNALESLDLSWNNFKIIPDAFFGSIPNCRHLDLSYNDFSSLPWNVFNNGLISLNLECIRIDVSDFVSIKNPDRNVEVMIFDNPLLDHEKDPNQSNIKFKKTPMSHLDVISYIGTQQRRNYDFSIMAKNTPLDFIKLMETSRLSEGSSDSADWRNPISRKQMLNGFDAQTLLVLLDEGKQEIVSGWESTFKEIFTKYIEVDPDLNMIDNQNGWSLRKILWTVSILSIRYLKWRKNPWMKHLEQFYKKYSERNVVSKLINSFSEWIAIQEILPVLTIYQRLNETEKPFLLWLLNIIANDFLQQFRNYVNQNDNDEKRMHNLIGIILEQLKKNAIINYEDDLSMFTLDETPVTELSNNWTPDDPGKVAMFFDYDEDGKWSFAHRLGIIWLNLKNSKKVIRNWVLYELKLSSENDSSRSIKNYEITASYNNQVLCRIFANDPIYWWWVPILQSKNPDIVVDRWHAGKEEDWINAISSNTKLAIIGSCGWSQTEHQILEKNNKTQIIATTGTGVACVNDAVFWTIIDQSIRTKKINRVWREPDNAFISQTEKEKFNNNRSKYLLPLTQIWPLLINKLNSLW